MSTCTVREQMKQSCNEDCPDWKTCPIAALIMKKAIELFSSYKPKTVEAGG